MNWLATVLVFSLLRVNQLLVPANWVGLAWNWLFWKTRTFCWARFSPTACDLAIDWLQKCAWLPSNDFVKLVRIASLQTQNLSASSWTCLTLCWFDLADWCKPKNLVRFVPPWQTKVWRLSNTFCTKPEMLVDSSFESLFCAATCLSLSLAQSLICLSHFLTRLSLVSEPHFCRALLLVKLQFWRTFSYGGLHYLA